MNSDIHILSTRTLTSASLAKASRPGIIIDSQNFIETQPVRSEALEKKLRQLAGQSLTVVFSSANAVTSVFSLIQTVPRWNIFCLSGATKAAVLAYMPENKITATADYGAELAEKVQSGSSGRDICFFCGDKRLNTIPEKLSQSLVRFQELVVYKTELRPQKINRHYDGILFFSPSAAESFFSLNKISKETLLFSIGKTTESALNQYSKNQVIIPEMPKADLLIDRAINFNFKRTTISES